MSIAVSAPVYAQIKELAVQADGAVVLLQNQVAVAQQASDELHEVLAELVDVSAIPPAPAPVVGPVATPADAPGIG